MNDISLKRLIIKMASKTETPIIILLGASVLISIGASVIKDSQEVSLGTQNTILIPIGYTLVLASFLLAILRLNYKDSLFILLGFPALLGTIMVII
jgi:hypothetical protein